jgi:hypothetical protein
MEIAVKYLHDCSEGRCWNKDENDICLDNGKICNRSMRLIYLINYSNSNDNEIITEGELTFITDYPLKNKAKLTTTKPVSTIRDVLNHFYNLYKQIYKEEEESTTIPIMSLKERIQMQNGLINRNKTNGKYGIWGHDIGDLWFEGILYYNSNTKEIKMSMGS